jgi:hypothetical protein
LILRLKHSGPYAFTIGTQAAAALTVPCSAPSFAYLSQFGNTAMIAATEGRDAAGAFDRIGQI